MKKSQMRKRSSYQSIPTTEITTFWLVDVKTIQ
jgi:hypothetical protein